MINTINPRAIAVNGLGFSKLSVATDGLVTIVQNLLLRVTLPVGISLMDWADSVTFDLDGYVVAQKIMSEDDWQNWAVQFTAAASLSGNNPPNPYQFDDWQVWAQAFCKALLV